MKHLEVLHDIHLSLLIFLFITRRTLQDLLCFYVSQYSPDFDKNDLIERSFSKFLGYMKLHHEKIFKKLYLYTYEQAYKIIFTDDSKQTLKLEINFQKLDITIITDIIQNTPFFPSCKTSLRRQLTCKSNTHISKCCSNCNKEHLCSICHRPQCKRECCFTKNLNAIIYVKTKSVQFQWPFVMKNQQFAVCNVVFA